MLLCRVYHTECYYLEYHDAECNHANAVKLSIFILSVSMLNDVKSSIMLSVIMLNAAMSSIIMSVIMLHAAI